ncbi:MAG: outer membrane beta-barrel protein, partial [Bacteroidia bacterium]
NFDPTNAFRLTARAEYFNDEDFVAGFGTGIFDFTVSSNIHIDNLTIIPEIRIDTAKDPLFYKNSDGKTPSDKSTQSFILAAVYHF